MIVPTLIDKIKGLKELFKIVPEDYNFHDDELEWVHWDMMKGELIVTYSMHDYPPTRVWYVTWHIKPPFFFPNPKIKYNFAIVN